MINLCAVDGSSNVQDHPHSKDTVEGILQSMIRVNFGMSRGLVARTMLGCKHRASGSNGSVDINRRKRRKVVPEPKRSQSYFPSISLSIWLVAHQRSLGKVSTYMPMPQSRRCPGGRKSATTVFFWHADTLEIQWQQSGAS